MQKNEKFNVLPCYWSVICVRGSCKKYIALSIYFLFFLISGLRLFLYAFEEKNADKFERLESLLIRMKQYESYFRAAPEAFIQITYRIINWTESYHFDSEGEFLIILGRKVCIKPSLNTFLSRLLDSHVHCPVHFHTGRIPHVRERNQVLPNVLLSTY